MKTKRTIKTILLLCTFAVNLPLTVAAQNAVITTDTEENNESYTGVADNAALNVSVEGVIYSGTNITLSNTFDGSVYGGSDIVGRGAYAGNGGILFLTRGSITTSGTFGHAFVLDGSSGTANNVNIETHGYQSNGAVARFSSTFQP